MPGAKKSRKMKIVTVLVAMIGIGVAERSGKREKQKEIERVRQPIAPALNPVEHSRHGIFAFRVLLYVSTEVLSRSRTVKKEMRRYLGLNQLYSECQRSLESFAAHS